MMSFMLQASAFNLLNLVLSPHSLKHPPTPPPPTLGYFYTSLVVLVIATTDSTSSIRPALLSEFFLGSSLRIS